MDGGAHLYRLRIRLIESASRRGDENTPRRLTAVVDSLITTQCSIIFTSFYRDNMSVADWPPGAAQPRRPDQPQWRVQVNAESHLRCMRIFLFLESFRSPTYLKHIGEN